MAVVERFLSKSQCMDCLPGQKKCRSREVAFSGSTVIKSDFPVWLTL